MSRAVLYNVEYLMDEPQQERPADGATDDPPGMNAPATSRRTMLAAFLTAAPTVVIMSNRPAWAGNGTCQTPSASVSVQTASYQPSSSSCYAGMSPGYWKQAYDKTSDSPHAPLSPLTRGTLPPNNPTFGQIFGTAMYSSYSANTFGYIYWEAPSSNEYHWITAYLNALNYSGYPLTGSQVILAYNGLYSVGGSQWSQAQAYNYIVNQVEQNAV
jgi:hypothetical protein